MSPLTKTNFIFLNLIPLFRGRSLRIVWNRLSLIILEVYSQCLLHMKHSHMRCLHMNHPHMICLLHMNHLQMSWNKTLRISNKCSLNYCSIQEEKKMISEPMQTQDSNLDEQEPDKPVSLTNSILNESVLEESVSQDLDLPIALRKATRKYT